MSREILQPGQRRQTAYEWDFEESDCYGDILDHNQCDRLSQYPRFFGFRPEDLPTKAETEDDDPGIELVLIRDSGTEYDGLDDRQWAYTVREGGKLVLPEYFDGGAKVPQKFHAELARWQSGPAIPESWGCDDEMSEIDGRYDCTECGEQLEDGECRNVFKCREGKLPRRHDMKTIFLREEYCENSYFIVDVGEYRIVIDAECDVHDGLRVAVYHDEDNLLIGEIETPPFVS